MCTLVVGIKTGGLFENGLALFEVVRERGGIKHLFYRKFGGVVDILFADFIVGAADNAIVDGQTRATELGKHFVGQFGERRGDVANLLFALFGILVEGEHANDGFFVLNVALLHQFFETFPVFGGVFRVDVGT